MNTLMIALIVWTVLVSIGIGGVALEPKLSGDPEAPTTMAITMVVVLFLVVPWAIYLWVGGAR